MESCPQWAGPRNGEDLGRSAPPQLMAALAHRPATVVPRTTEAASWRNGLRGMGVLPPLPR
jgi:hypothetical protein